jgi:BASS family bile acid:Na+ symporter
MVLLMVLTAGYTAVVLPLLLEVVSVDPTKIPRSLGLLMLLPLGVGLLVKARFGHIAVRMRTPFNRTSSVSLVLLIALHLWLGARISMPLLC